jgi:UDP-GlcNAc3NAcA epimerase
LTDVVSVIGARPQFIKAAVVSRALEQAGCREFVIHTGQHYDHGMSGVFFEELQIREPDANLGVGSGSHAHQTGETLVRLEQVLAAQSPDWVIVYGDTNSTLAGVLAAAKLNLNIAHVEAGMRSYRRTMPEEINRIVADRLSTLLFCATPTSVANLEREGMTRGVFQVGDVMYDALLRFGPIAKKQSTILRQLGLTPKSYALLTLHRAENVDSPERLREWVDAVARLKVSIVFPVHPRTRGRLAEWGLAERLGPHVRLIPPLGYLDTVALEGQAEIVLTDSGGVQRESYFLSVPSVILRRETEWPEIVSSGASTLAGERLEDLEGIVTAMSAATVATVSGFGDGHAADRIARELRLADGFESSWSEPIPPIRERWLKTTPSGASGTSVDD